MTLVWRPFCPRRRPLPTSPSWSEAVWRRCPLATQFWEPVVACFCWTSSRQTLSRVERSSLSSPGSCAKTVVPMWSGCWASSAWVCLLPHVSAVTQLPEPTVARSVFRVDGLVSISTGKSFVILGFWAARQTEPSHRWFPPQFPSG